MTRSTLRNSVAVAVALAADGFAVACLAALPTGQPAGHELSHAVPFELGATRLNGGDDITIESVTGTGDKMAVGNLYVIQGTYKLASQESATLLASVTADSRTRGADRAIPQLKTQSVTVKQGQGRFSLILYMPYDGYPHVSLYPVRGESFANAYFGTGNSVLKTPWWGGAK